MCVPQHTKLIICKSFHKTSKNFMLCAAPESHIESIDLRWCSAHTRATHTVPDAGEMLTLVLEMFVCCTKKKKLRLLLIIV